MIPHRSSHPVIVDTGDARLAGDLTLPAGAAGIVAFAHGSGSSRRSPRNLEVAATLQRRGLGTLLFDLLTPDEAWVDERTAALRFDIPLLGRRLVGALDWLAAAPDTARLSVGIFGASTGAAAALIAAAERPERAHAVVSRGGRPDLAEAWLPRVTAPVLLVVGSLDTEVLELNRKAFALLAAEKRLEIVPGATHLFPEPGALERVAERAAEWFSEKLARAARAA
jgi:dienelactone hydrolase